MIYTISYNDLMLLFKEEPITRKKLILWYELDDRFVFLASVGNLQVKAELEKVSAEENGPQFVANIRGIYTRVEDFKRNDLKAFTRVIRSETETIYTMPLNPESLGI